MEDLDLTVPDGYEIKWLTLKDEFEPPVMLMILFVAIAALIIPCAFQVFFGAPLSQLSGTLRQSQGGVLLVVAHPDDEAMFFWPTLLQLRGSGAAISVLCLSTGNFDGLGERRASEMKASCAGIGVSGAHLRIVDDPELQDGFHSWPVTNVANHVLDFIRDRQASLVITFDSKGVSGHPNHISTCLGVRHAHDNARRSNAAKAFQVLELESIGFLHKYIGPLSLLLAPSVELGETDAGIKSVCTWVDPFACLRALTIHWSQLVWYRVLFTIFSRYAFVNTYKLHDLVSGSSHVGNSKVDCHEAPISDVDESNAVSEKTSRRRRG